MLASWKALIDPVTVTLKGKRVTHRAPDDEPVTQIRFDALERNQLTLDTLIAARRPMTSRELVFHVGGSQRRIENALNALLVANQIKRIPPTSRVTPAYWVAL